MFNWLSDKWQTLCDILHWLRTGDSTDTGHTFLPNPPKVKITFGHSEHCLEMMRRGYGCVCGAETLTKKENR